MTDKNANSFENALKTAVEDRSEDLNFFKSFDEGKPSVSNIYKKAGAKRKYYNFGIVASAACVMLLSVTALASGLGFDLFSTLNDADKSEASVARDAVSEEPASTESEQMETESAKEPAESPSEPEYSDTPIMSMEPSSTSEEMAVDKFPAWVVGISLLVIGLLLGLILRLSAKNITGGLHALYRTIPARIALIVLALGSFIAGIIWIFLLCN
jgi:hypothetical protein